MDLVVNKCELPYAYEDDSNSETSSNPSISPLTVISLDLNNDASFRNVYPVTGPELSPLFIDTSLANFTFEQYVIGNNLLNYCSQAPGYSVFRHMTCNNRPRTPRSRLAGLSAPHIRRRRPVSEYLEYYSRMNTPLCITFDSLPETARHLYYEPHTHPHFSDRHVQLSVDNHKLANLINNHVDPIRKWHSSPSVYFYDSLQYFENQYFPCDFSPLRTHPMCAGDKYACRTPSNLVHKKIKFIQGMDSKNDCMHYEWHQEKTSEGALIDCEGSNEGGCIECFTVESPCPMDTNFTYQDPFIPENGPNHINWEPQLPPSTYSPSIQPSNVQFVSDPSSYQLTTDPPYIGSVLYYYTHVAQTTICPCVKCSQYMMQGLNPYLYYYS